MRFIEIFLSFIIFMAVWITPLLVKLMNVYFIIATSIFYMLIAMYLVYQFQSWFKSKLK